MAPQKKNYNKEGSMADGKEMPVLAQELRNLQNEQEELKSKIELKKVKISLWRDILKAETGTEIEEIVSCSPIENLTPATTETQNMIMRFNELDTILLGYKRSGIIAQSTPDGNTLVQFLPSKNNKFPEDLLLQLSQSKDDNTFSVVDHNLQDFVPIDELVEDYLSGPAANVKTFITNVALHTSQLMKRHTMFEDIRQTMIPIMYYNPNRTRLCLNLQLELTDKETTGFELILNYDLLDILPHKVTAEHFDGSKPDDQMQELIKGLVEELHEGPANKVLRRNIFEESGKEDSNENYEGTKFSDILEGEV